MFWNVCFISLRRVLTVASGALVVLSLPACKSSSQGLGNDAYVSNDGGYNPYPGSGGQASRESLLPRSGAGAYVPQYDQAVPAPPPGFDLPGDGGSFKESPAAKKPSTSSSSTTRSSSTASKPKSTSSKTTAKKPTTVAKKKPTSSGGRVHTVVRGDTLYGLALKNKTTVAKIKALNGLKSDMLSIGKKLKMP